MILACLMNLNIPKLLTTFGSPGAANHVDYIQKMSQIT